ncbi:MAG: cysteine desulfurase family protein, partial [Caulobacteraceae bacterium]
MAKVYLDHNATSPIRPQAADAMMRALQMGGNPSSVHAQGRAARSLVEDGRSAVSALVGARNLIFTGGGTEANALGIEGSVAAGGVGRLIVGATEHDAVTKTALATGLPVEIWPVDANGVADLDWLAERLARWNAADGRPLVALMLANNETGVIQPVAQTAALVRQADGLLHVDAVQAAGKIAVDIEALGADTLALSAHKLGGPQGVGALAYGARAKLKARLHGGGQELGLRAGTENVAGIAGFAAAATAALAELPHAASQAALRNATADRLVSAADVRIAGAGVDRLPGTLCLATKDIASSIQVMALDLDGVMVSSGSACSSGKVTPSRV